MTAQTTLSNGIELPAQWPPRYEVPAERKEMPVPYLQQKPEVIPVNTGRQLFVDSFLIEETTLVPVYHKPNFYAGNPVLEPTEKWEETTEGAPYASPFSDGIWYDDQTGKFRMWYLAGAGTIHKQSNQTFYTCYAESEDGKHWTKPTLDLVPGTNIVDTCNRDAATVWLDRMEKDPAKRWKFFNVERRPLDSRWSCILKYSADGIHWSEGVAQSGDLYDRTSAFYNPFTGKWALSMRYSTPVSYRSRAYLEHSDPEMLVSLAHRMRRDVPDKFVHFWFTPDDKELRHPKYPEVEPGIYNFDAIAYESIMLGLYSAWCGPENDICKRDGIQKRNVVSLGYSRDGFHFSRPTHEAFMDVNETEGAWNWGNMQSINGVPLIVGDSLYFYSSGRRLNKIMWDSYTSTGLATLRRDGFVSMRAGREEGTLTTEKLSFDGKYFFVNADVKAKKAQLAVELLDEQGTPIPGFTKKDCVVMKKADSTKQLVTWKNNADLSSLKGKVIRAKFYLTNGDLYAFWISPWQSGESRGYTAGGGPGLNACGVDRP
ncbi:hypothetical protein M3090_11705 [Bacteroides sp. ET71]|uniref:hypothetical protein n=1 Tax=Bacteroides sp. ET71 TaxID=2939421 RepID=UPI002011CF34|nr:hypothetical protein [Bacteroides sp. ET71]MCL1617052.1 hypothetical protein [Bacteroides sp. ET71]